MIELDICSYCHECLEFKPQVTDRPNLIFVNHGARGFIGDPAIKCENRFKCQVLYNYLKKENKND